MGLLLSAITQTNSGLCITILQYLQYSDYNDDNNRNYKNYLRTVPFTQCEKITHKENLDQSPNHF